MVWYRLPSLQERVFDQTAHFGRSALSWETFDCNAHIVAVSLYRLLMLATSDEAHFILVPPQWICFQCWWQFNYRTKSLENRVCFSVWMAITGVIYHVNRVSSSSSIRTEGGHTSIQCHPAVQRNPGNYQQQRVEGGKPVRWRPVAGHRGHRQHLPSQSQWQCDIASARAVVRLGVRFLVNPTIWGRFRLRGRVCGHKMEAWWPQRPNWGRPMCAMSNTCKRKTYPDWAMNNHPKLRAIRTFLIRDFPWPVFLLVCELFFLFLHVK